MKWRSRSGLTRGYTLTVILKSPLAKSIKSMIRAAFHSDDPLWQGMALGQGLAACQAAVAGMGIPPK